MPTYTRAQIRDAIDTHTAGTLGVTPIVPVVYGNVDNTALSTGTVAYVKQRVIFSTDKQMDLGNSCARRVRGYVTFSIYTRYDSGDLERDQVMERISVAFRSTQIGGATMLDSQVVGSMRAENWAVTALQVPFYYETHT